MVMDIVIVILVLSPIAAFFGGVIVTGWSVAGLKKENERLNQKLQRHNPRDAHGRFTKDK